MATPIPRRENHWVWVSMGGVVSLGVWYWGWWPKSHHFFSQR